MMRTIVNILWTSFLIAILADGWFFSIFDPHDLTQLAGWHDASALAGYSVGFFFFWGIGGLASWLTYWMMRAAGNGRSN